MREFDWIRTALMFEPRGHAMMSGSMLYPSSRDDCDIGVLYIETSGCLAMCGHGTIGTVTIAIEKGLVKPRIPGELHLETPAGRVVASYTEEGGKVKSVKLVNVPSYLHAKDLSVDCPELGGELKVDVAYGGNFYAIVDPQTHYRDLEDLTASDILRISPLLRERLNAKYSFIHPEDPRICGLSHLEWTGNPNKRAQMPATRFSMVIRPSTVHPVVPAPRRAWRNWRRVASWQRVIVLCTKVISAASSPVVSKT